MPPRKTRGIKPKYPKESTIISNRAFKVHVEALNGHGAVLTPAMRAKIAERVHHMLKVEAKKMAKRNELPK